MAGFKQSAAWAHAAKWNSSLIQKYGLHCATWYSRAFPERINCADLAIHLIVDFASANELPVILTGAGRLFDSRSFGSTRKAFEMAARDAILARDLQAPTNTRLIGHDPVLVRPGHLLLHLDPRSPIWHTQIVTRVTASAKWISILQGNMHRGKWDSFRYLMGKDPRPWIPDPPATGAFTEMGHKYHQNYGRNQSSRYEVPWRFIEIREWNFVGWNQE